MQHGKRSLKLFLATGLILVLVMFIPPLVSGQDFPNKPITFYCGYVAGATTDLTARALATGAEKLLSVPVVVENRPGASATVAASLVASKSPDGYTLGVVDSGAISTTPLLLKVNYDPQKDFTPIMQYLNPIAGIVVLNESPLKTIQDFIAYAKAHPGMSYSSTGLYTYQHIGLELFAHSMGIKFKHIPYKGGAEAVTAFLGKHVDFLQGTGSHIPYLEQGTARMLMVFTTDHRDPNYPNVPTSRELGAADIDPPSYVVIGPKGMPDAVVKKLEATFKKVVESDDFQALLKRLNLPYAYKGGAQVAKDLPAAVEEYKRALGILGITLKKE